MATPGPGRTAPRVRASPRHAASASSTPKSSLSEIKAAARKKKQKGQDSPAVKIHDPFAAAHAAKDQIRGQTGLVFDEVMAEHANPWDKEHIERPERLLRSKERCDQIGLTSRCVSIEGRKATTEELESVHDKAYLEKLQGISSANQEDAQKACLADFHSVYMNSQSWECALMAAGSAIELTNALIDGKIQNGMALIRPPGHHALKTEGCGFCLCNNAAIAARQAQKSSSIERILIVDFDVHHGQATQFEFYDDPNVVYFSIHRYEDGRFWPHLRESNFDYVGGDVGSPGAGKNFNVPLNTIGMGDADYMAIFHQVLLPMAHEFRPDLVLVSAGFDAALGDPEGEMSVTPAAYGHMIHALMGAASGGKVAVFMEGGYFVESLAEGVAFALRALLGDPQVSLGSLPSPNSSLIDSVLNVIAMQREHWDSLCLQDDFSISTYDVIKDVDCHVPALVYSGKGLFDKGRATDLKYEAGEHYAKHSSATEAKFLEELKSMRNKYEVAMKRSALAKNRVALVFDKAMMSHRNEEGPDHPERPARIEQIFETHKSYGLLDRPSLVHLPSRIATDEELGLVHEAKHLEDMKALPEMSQPERFKASEAYDSIYFNEGSYDSALLAAGSLLNVVDKVCEEEAARGVAIIRPPGHHAEADEACGFCLYNNVAIAAKYALEMHSLKRILILDWDVHHGNGIQNMFYDDPRVLYISIHRYDNGTFFPGKIDANHDFVGSGAGEGFNVNIPWNGSGMGDPEYALAFYNLVLPIAYQFNPELVFVSAGFDAARGDPLGRCKISPEFYGIMTHHLTNLASGKVIVALEGGYNLNSISYSMTMCTKALLGDPVAQLAPYTKPIPSAVESVKATMRSLAPFWSCLKFGLIKLPDNVEDLRTQMMFKMAEFVQSSGGDIDYIPPQFGSYAQTFSVNTLSAVKLTSRKSELTTSDAPKKIDTNNSKKEEQDLTADLEKMTIETGDSKPVEVAAAAASSEPIPISNRDVYIPNQFGPECYGSPTVYTLSSSSSLRKPTDLTTTDSTKK